MANLYELNFGGLDIVQRALAQAPGTVMREVRVFMKEAVALLQAEVVDRTPAAYGDLRRSIIGRVSVNESEMIGVLGSPLAYAVPVELGAKPHFMGEKGIDALADWVKVKIPLGQSVSIKTGRPLKTKGLAEAARQVAFAIARKIAKKGTKGAFMFRDALSANLAEIEGRWALAVARIAQQMDGPA